MKKVTLKDGRTITRFHGKLLQTGKTACGFKVPNEVVESLGTSRKPAVSVTILGHTYRSSIAFMGGVFMLGMSTENRAAAQVDAGDEVDVDLELDTAPRLVNVPPDFQKAIDKDARAKKFFESLSYSNKLRHVLSVEGAKTDETRQRRIAKSVSGFHDGKA